MPPVTFGQVLNQTKTINGHQKGIKTKLKSKAKLKHHSNTETDTGDTITPVSISFKDMLHSLNRVKLQQDEGIQFTNFTPTIRHHPNLAHLKEVINEGHRSKDALWASQRQFEWVNATSQRYPRLLEERTFFWSQRGVKIPWYQLVPLVSFTPLQGHMYDLIDFIDCKERILCKTQFQNGCFKVKGVNLNSCYDTNSKSSNSNVNVYKRQSINDIIQDDANTFRAIKTIITSNQGNDANKNNHTLILPVFKTDNGNVIYIKKS